MTTTKSTITVCDDALDITRGTNNSGMFTWDDSLDTLTISSTSPSYSFAPSMSYDDIITTSSLSNSIVMNGTDADIKLNGWSLREHTRQVDESLAKIEERLNILRVNVELEADWQELAELGRQYREKEAEILEGLKIWDTLCK